MSKLNKGTIQIWFPTIVGIVIVLLLGGGIYYWQKSVSTPVSTPPVSNPSLPKIIGWHDPQNIILGFQFDIPNSWYEAPQTTERSIDVSSCPPNTAGCDYVYLTISVDSASQPGPYVRNLISGQIAKEGGYTETTVTVDGVSANKLINSKYGDNRIIYVQKENGWYVFYLFPGTQNKIQAYETLEEIVSTFRFTTPQPPQASVEYQLFKDIDEWTLTYQDKTVSAMSCSDGRKGNIATNYVFTMNSSGYGESPGDIDTPYEKVIAILQSNGWQQCKTIGATELQETQGTSEVFIKNDKLIGVFKHYSMGVGNSLRVSIQYDK